MICALQQSLARVVHTMEIMKKLGRSGLGPEAVGRPVGYTRTKIFNRNIIVKTLVDGGNMFGSLISHELAKLLKLQIRGRAREVGTAAINGSVTVVGKTTKPVKIFIEGIDRSISFQPYVVKNLAHPINLGENLLRTYHSDQMYRPSGVWLKTNGGCVELEGANLDLTRPSIDARFRQILEQFKANGKNPWSGDSDILDMRIQHIGAQIGAPGHESEDEEVTEDTASPGPSEVPGVLYNEDKKGIEWGETATRIYNLEKVQLKARHTTVVMMSRGKCDKPAQPLAQTANDVYLMPKMSQDFMNKHQLFVHPGVHHRDGNNIKVSVTNFSEQDQTLPRGCHVGRILEAERHYAAPTISAVRGKPQATPAPKLKERREFIIKQLKLDTNPILKKDPSAMEEVIQVFMEGWSAISTNETDFGKTKAMNFYIQLEPGSKPVRDRVRPLNPMQEQDLRRQLDEWFEAGVIEPSNSAWTSALVPCKKKGTDKFRWAIDYRKLNTMTVKDAYPLSSIEANLHKLSGTCLLYTSDAADE